MGQSLLEQLNTARSAAPYPAEEAGIGGNIPLGTTLPRSGEIPPYPEAVAAPGPQPPTSSHLPRGWTPSTRASDDPTRSRPVVPRHVRKPSSFAGGGQNVLEDLNIFKFELDLFFKRT